MAKKESFFIRGTVTPDDSGLFVQTTIDLSSYVSALAVVRFGPNLARMNPSTPPGAVLTTPLP